MRRVLTFDDIALVPKYSKLKSRTDPSLSTKITSDLEIDIPILASPMDTVISWELAEILSEKGSLPIFHRFYKDRREFRDRLETLESPFFVSTGISSTNISDAFRIIRSQEHLRGVNIDIAHGHSSMMVDAIGEFKIEYPDLPVMAGAVCTAEGYQRLVDAGADCVRVGIGPGSICVTRMVTGFGVPQFAALRDCAEIAQVHNVPMICDGGIRDSRDVVLALAAGANAVLIGKLFAMTKESAAPKDLTRGGTWAHYRGQASEDFQSDYFGNVKEGTVPEGVSYWGEVQGSARDLIDRLTFGVRSGMTYGGAATIRELQANAEFVEVTQSYMLESQPRTT